MISMLYEVKRIMIDIVVPMLEKYMDSYDALMIENHDYYIDCEIKTII